MTIQNQKNIPILLLRVISMFFIVLCHIIPYYTFIPFHTELSQVFNVGVEIFFLISGFLYGTKNITKFKDWIFKRWQKICIPVFLIVIIDVLALFFSGYNTSLAATAIYAFNLEGFIAFSDSVFSFIPCIYPNLGPLWFSTIIFLCYLTVPALQKIKFLINKSKNANFVKGTLLFSFAIFSFILCTFCNFYINYFVVFSLGYFFGDIKLTSQKFSFSKYLIFSLSSFAIQAIRFLSRLYFDGTCLYKAITCVSQAVLAIWIFISVFFLYRIIPSFISKIGNWEIITFCDELSFYVYLTHCLFCKGEAFNLFYRIPNLLIVSPLFFVVVFISSVLLKKLSEIVTKYTFGRIRIND